ncbi:MAG: hypothetical protein JW774_05010 [Candidatus Aureabacteria bacterium]|nr:hypothetical protein [Candidatus Auribacterota bacterium]
MGSKKFKSYFFLFLTLIQLLFNLAMGVYLPEYFWPDYRCIYHPSFLSTKPVFCQKGLKKIFYVLDFLSADKQFYLLNNKKEKYYDPYNILYFPDNSLIASHEKYRKLVKFHLTKHELGMLDISSTNMFTEDMKTYLFTGSSWDKPDGNESFYKIDARNLQVINQFSLKSSSKTLENLVFNFNKNSNFLTGVQIDNDLFILTMNGKLIQMNADSGMIYNTIDVPQPLPVQSAFDISRYKCYYITCPQISFSLDLFSIIEIDLKTFIIKRKGRHFCSLLKYFSDKQWLLLLNSFSGTIQIYDVVSMNKIKTIDGAFACRDFTFDNKLKYLFISHYFSGMVDVVDFQTCKVLYSFYAGPLIRTLCFSDATKRMYIGSALGIFEFDPSVAGITL